MDEAQYYIRQGANTQGPFPVSRIQGWIDQGRVREHMLMSADGLRWVEGGLVGDFQFPQGEDLGAAPVTAPAPTTSEPAAPPPIPAAHATPPTTPPPIPEAPTAPPPIPAAPAEPAPIAAAPPPIPAAPTRTSPPPVVMRTSGPTRARSSGAPQRRAGRRSSRLGPRGRPGRSPQADTMAVLGAACAGVALLSLALPFATVLDLVSVTGFETKDGPFFAVGAAVAGILVLVFRTGGAGRGALLGALIAFYLLTGFYIIDIVALPEVARPAIGIYLGALASAGGVVVTHIAHGHTR